MVVPAVLLVFAGEPGVGHAADDDVFEFPYKLSCNFSPRATRYAHAIASGNIIAAAAVAWLSYIGDWAWRTEAMLYSSPVSALLPAVMKQLPLLASGVTPLDQQVGQL